MSSQSPSLQETPTPEKTPAKKLSGWEVFVLGFCAGLLALGAFLHLTKSKGKKPKIILEDERDAQRGVNY